MKELKQIIKSFDLWIVKLTDYTVQYSAFGVFCYFIYENFYYMRYNCHM